MSCYICLVSAVITAADAMKWFPNESDDYWTPITVKMN